MLTQPDEIVPNSPPGIIMDATIKASFWSDSRLEEQAPEVKLACLWLISNPSRDLCGFTRVSHRRFTFETGLDAKWLEAPCEALPSSFQAPSEGVYFAVHFLRHQFGKGGRLSLKNNVIKACVRHASQLPEKLQEAFWLAYPELTEHEENTSLLQAPCKPLTPFPEGVIAEHKHSKAKPRERESEGKPADPDLPGIVDLYPRREGVKPALDSLRTSIRKGADPAVILSGVRAIAAIIPRMPGGSLNKFVPSAERFFRDERWRDDPQTWLRQGASPASNGAMPPPPALNGRAGKTIKIGQS